MKLKRSISLFLCLLLTLASLPALSFGAAADSTASPALSLSLTDPSEASLLRGYGCVPTITQDGLTLIPDGSNGAPFAVIGDGNWADYTVEVETHGIGKGGVLFRVGDHPINNANGFDGYAIAYDSAYLFSAAGVLNTKETSATWKSITTATNATALSYTENLHWSIRVVGTRIYAAVTNMDNPSVVKKLTMYDDTFAWGKVGLRQLSTDTGSFRNLKVTVNKTINEVALVNSSLTDPADAALFEGFGCTPSVTQDGLALTPDDSNGYPFAVVGDDNWVDYKFEIDSHGLGKGGVVARSGADAINHSNGFAGYTYSYDGAWLFAGTGKVNSSTSAAWTQIKPEGATNAFALAATANLHWEMTVRGNHLTVRVTNIDTGAVEGRLDLVDTTFTNGKAGIRFDKTQNATYTNLRVSVYKTLKSESVVIDDPLTDPSAASLFDCYGCSVTTGIDGLAIQPDNSNAWPYVAIGESDWEDYTVEADVVSVPKGGLLFRVGDNAVNHSDGFDGYCVSYDSAYIFAAAGVMNPAQTAGAWTQIKTGAYAFALNYHEEMHWKITVNATSIRVTVTDLATGSVLGTLSMTDCAASRGKVGFRVEKADPGLFRNLKVTVREYNTERSAYDMDGDGTVGNADITCLIRYLAKWNSLPEPAFGDIDGNGCVNNRDAIQLIRYIAGWSNDQPLLPSAFTADLGVGSEERLNAISCYSAEGGNLVRASLFGDNLAWRGNGYGVYDPQTETFNEELVEAIRQSGVTALRYPGGIEGDYFHWYETVGDDRVPQVDPFSSDYPTEADRDGESYYPYFGLDEFIALCRKLNVKAVIQLNAGTGTPEEAVSLVRYCLERDYPVSSFCIGNEVHINNAVINGVNIRKTPEQYIAFANAVYDALGDDADRITLGVIGLPKSHPLCYDGTWDQKILTALGDKIDFIDCHLAYAPYNTSSGDSAEKIICSYLAAPDFISGVLDDVKAEIALYAPGSDIGIQITEYGPLGTYYNGLVGSVFLSSLLSRMTEDDAISEADHLPLLNHPAAANLVGYNPDGPRDLYWDNICTTVFRWYAEQAGRRALTALERIDVGTSSEKVGLIPSVKQPACADSSVYVDETTGPGSILLTNRSSDRDVAFALSLPYENITVTRVTELYHDDPTAQNLWFCPDTVTPCEYSTYANTVSSGELRVTTKPVSVVRVDFTIEK